MDLHEYAQVLQEKTENANEFACCHLGNSQLHQKTHYDQRVQGASCEPGQPVWLYVPSKKVGPQSEAASLMGGIVRGYLEDK